MSRYQLSKSGQPLWKRTLLAVADFAASLKLAVVLIFSCATGLAWATFVESEYGTPAVQYGVYSSPIFAVLLLMLSINIFTAAAVRFPWKKHQTGFVITHIGLLVLLFGCLQTRRGWIDAQMPIFEDRVGYKAYTDDYHFELSVGSADAPGEEQVIEIPFTAGPFNWSEYGKLFEPLGTDPIKAQEFSLLEKAMNPLSLAWRNTLRATSGAAFSIAERHQGVIYDGSQAVPPNDIKLEVVDFYANSLPVVSPMVEMKITAPPQSTIDEETGKQVETEQEPQTFQLTGKRMFPDYYPMGTGNDLVIGGGRFTFRSSSSPAETAAFLSSQPQGVPGEAGQIVLFASDKSHHLDVASLGPEPTPVGETGLLVKLVRREADGTLTTDGEMQRLALGAASAGTSLKGGPAVQLELLQGEASLGDIILFADRPEYNVQRHEAGSEVYGTYWVDQSKKADAEVRSGTGGSRIDVLLGDDNETLYYRYWNRSEVAALEKLPTDGAKVDAFKMPFAQLQMYVGRFVPRTESGVAFLPLPFDIEIEKRRAHTKRAAAKLRLTIGQGKEAVSKELWLGAMPANGLEEEPGPGQQVLVSGADKQVAIAMQPTDAFTDVNFQVRLEKFHRKLDPGTEQAAFYGSTIDILSRDPGDPHAARKVLHDDVRIMMNVPYDVVDPQTGLTYRLFQESFNGPWKPGDRDYEMYADKSTGREQFYLSVLTVNYDPGRAAKYLGCLLICVGIFTMFYMRAYFFKPASATRTLQRESADDMPSDTDISSSTQTSRKEVSATA